MIKFNKKLTAFLIAVLSSTTLGTSNLYALEDSAEAVGVFDWIPLPATLSRFPNMGSYKDHYIHSLKIETNAAGRFELTVKLPEDLTAGDATSITLPEVWRNADGDRFHFRSAKGNLECTAYDSWMGASCKVLHLDFGSNTTERVEFVKAKYAGTRKADPLADVAFNTQAEPFGRIRFSDPEFLVEGAMQAIGHWQTQITAEDGSVLDTIVFFDFDRGAYQDVNQSALIGGLYFVDNTVDGGWGRSDDDMGWFKLTFNGDSFTGTWGRHDSDDPLGTWIGHR
jgi:hypothetical protein